MALAMPHDTRYAATAAIPPLSNISSADRSMLWLVNFALAAPSRNIVTPVRIHATIKLTESLAPVALERTYDSRGMKPKNTNDANVTTPFFQGESSSSGGMNRRAVDAVRDAEADVKLSRVPLAESRHHDASESEAVADRFAGSIVGRNGSIVGRNGSIGGRNGSSRAATDDEIAAVDARIVRISARLVEPDWGGKDVDPAERRGVVALLDEARRLRRNGEVGGSNPRGAASDRARVGSADLGGERRANARRPMSGRVIAEDSCLIHVTLEQAHTFSVFQINCREKDHGRHSRKLCMNCSPALWLFSG